MPELPDVEIFRRYFDSTALRQRIAMVDVRDERILGDISPQILGRTLHEQIFTETARHGKFLFAHTDNEKWLVLHFGMTGYPKYYKNDNDEPEHTKAVFRFENGYRLAYACSRMLGQVTLTGDPADIIQSHGLGPDAIDNDLDAAAFRQRFRGKSTAIKTCLMDQKIVAGIGNVYADEILFQARIDPALRADGIDDKVYAELYRVMRRVLRMVADKQADPSQLPRGYLLPLRNEGAPCPRCRGIIGKMLVNGRTTYYCPGHQAA